ncbi:MAG TPA: pyridoxamine 5'-phosphate oxidase [Streptosporangiaceae bacterium]|nr:pyridoxamine 5'-phosphate oxidase [Streptosporangiaceae bacterium]
MHTSHHRPGSPGSRALRDTQGPQDAKGAKAPAGSAGLQAPQCPEALSEDMLAADPIEQFSRWLEDAAAAGLPEPNAMVLATTSAEGRSRARMVLLKGHDAGGFVFYTNRTSRKGRDLAVNPWACLLFPWHALGRQVTVEGPVTEMSREESEPYFMSRPRGSRIGAWASRQSQVIGSRGELEARYAELERRWPPGTEVPMPDFWGGYRVVPETVEFWRSRENRLHDRLRYARAAGGGWVIQRLSP